ncbi:MAG: nuclease-related domain-containing protein [Kiritimatiellia bacterium]
MVRFLTSRVRSFLPELKGWFGEKSVTSLLRQSLDPTVYHLISNVMIPTQEGTTQIDHIIVSRYGVFVLEVKNYTGWIYGNEKDRPWTKVIYIRESTPSRIRSARTTSTPRHSRS